MLLSENDQIKVGIGCLYAPPFLSRVLLYRIFEIKQTILITHKEAVFCTEPSRLGIVTAVAATFVPPNVICVRCCFDSAFAAMKDLLRLPAIEIPAPKRSAITECFGALTVRCEQFDLGLTEKIIFADEGEDRRTMRLGKSNFQVTGQMKIRQWPRGAPIKHSKRRYIKVSVGASGSNIKYSLNSTSDWNLTAVDIEKVGCPPLEINLERIKQ